MKKTIIFVLLVLILGTFFGCAEDKLTVEQSTDIDENLEGSLPTESALQQSQNEKDIPQDVVYCDGADNVNEWVPGKGQVNLSGGITQALKDEQYNDVYLYVRLTIYDPEGQEFYDEFTFEGKTREEWRSSLESINHEYDEGHTEFFNERIEAALEKVETTKEKEEALAVLQTEFG